MQRLTRPNRRRAVLTRVRRVLRNYHRWPLLPFAIPVVVLLRLIRPWLLVRWGNLYSSRIGHFAANTELYLCERAAGINMPKRRHVDIFFIEGLICNQQLAKMWKRVLHVWPGWMESPINRANRLIHGVDAIDAGKTSEWATENGRWALIFNNRPVA